MLLLFQHHFTACVSQCFCCLAYSEIKALKCCQQTLKVAKHEAN